MIKVGAHCSGVGSFDEALKTLNIKYKNIYQAEIDKFARQTYLANNEPPLIYDWDLYDTDVEELTEKYGSLDIFMSSVPCQSFSLAGKRGGEDDERGLLFYESLNFIRINNPRFFIFENVKGLLSIDKGEVFGKWIDLLGGKSINGSPIMFPNNDSVKYHIYYKVLNAKDYNVPQNRERVFIIGIRDDADNNFSWPKPIPLMKRLKDVLEDEVDEKYYLSEKMLDYLKFNSEIQKNKGNGFKFAPIDGNSIGKAITTKEGQRMDDNFVKVNSATSKGYEIAKIGEDSINFEHPNSKTRRGRVGVGVGQTLTTSCNQGVATYDTPKVKFQLTGGKWDKIHEQSGRVYDENGISPTIHTMQGGYQEPKVAIGAIRDRNPDNPTSRQSGLPTQQMLEINENGTSNCLTTVQKDNVVIESGYRIRKLTPRECFRLMDFPDTFDISKVSDTQAYKQAGNSIVVAVLENIIKQLKL